MRLADLHVSRKLGMVLHIRSILVSFSIGLALFIFGGAPRNLQGPPPPQVKMDRKIYPEPALPRLPRAGGKFKDPTFGTEIMRVTDETSPDGGTFYSYWPTFNCDTTRLLVRTSNDGTAHIYEFDAANFAIGSRKLIPASSAGYPNLESAIWSGSDPDSLFALVGTRIFAYHPSKGSYTLIADMSRDFPPGEFLWQLSLSRETDDNFAFARRRTNAEGGSDYVGYGVYSRSRKAVILKQDIQKNDLDEIQIDKSGRWLVVKGEVKTTGKGFSIRDLQNNGARKDLKYGDPDYALAHSDNGSGFASGFNNFLNTIDRRSFANPKPITTLLNLGKDWSQGLHVSHLAASDDWILVSFYEVGAVPNPPLGPFHNEIILVKTDGSDKVIRLLHHRSVYKDYYDTPRANINMDGRFVAFTSNWGGRQRHDMFIARIQTPTTGPKPAPAAVRPRRVGN